MFPCGVFACDRELYPTFIHLCPEMTNPAML